MLLPGQDDAPAPPGNAAAAASRVAARPPAVTASPEDPAGYRAQEGSAVTADDGNTAAGAPPVPAARAPPVATAAAGPAAGAPTDRVPTAAARLAEARAAAHTAVETYARAIETRDLAAIRRAYPGLSPEERSAWKKFFRSTRDFKASLAIDDFTLSGATAEARVTGTYEYDNRTLNRTERRPVTFRATLARRAGGWRLISIR